MTEGTFEQAISYFKKHTVYDKLFAVMRKKYTARGQLCGTFVLNNLTTEEVNTLSGFIGMDLGKENTVKISFLSLKKALERSRFHALAWEEILINYDKKPLLSNKEEQMHKKEMRNIFKDCCLELCKKEDVKRWLSGLLYEEKSGYRIIEKQLNEDREALMALLKNVIYALEHLPVDEGKKRMIPVYAAEITGNPHYFDEGTSAFRFLLNYGEYRFGHAEEKISGIEQRESILYQMGILKDDLSNCCLAYGILGIKADGDAYEGLRGFCREKQAVQIT